MHGGHREAFGRRKPLIGDVVEMLQPITSSHRKLMAIHALDERTNSCTAISFFFDSLNEILDNCRKASYSRRD